MMKIKVCIFMMLLFLSACSTSPGNNYYTLTALAPHSSKQPSNLAPSIAIMSITLPELVDRPHLVVGGNGSRVDILEFHRWAESLKSSIPRVMADNLSRQLGNDQVVSYPQVAALDSALQLSVDFQGFSVTDGFVLLDALWLIKGNGKVVHNGRTRSLQKISEGYESVADAYSRALLVLCADIAKAVTAKNGK